MVDRPGNRAIPFSSNCSESPNSCLGRQLPFLEDVVQVLADRWHRDLVEVGELPLSHPDGALDEPDVEARDPVVGLVENTTPSVSRI